MCNNRGYTEFVLHSRWENSTCARVPKLSWCSGSTAACHPGSAPPAPAKTRGGALSRCATRRSGCGPPANRLAPANRPPTPPHAHGVYAHPPSLHARVAHSPSRDDGAHPSRGVRARVMHIPWRCFPCALSAASWTCQCSPRGALSPASRTFPARSAPSAATNQHHYAQHHTNMLSTILSTGNLSLQGVHTCPVVGSSTFVIVRLTSIA